MKLCITVIEVCWGVYLYELINKYLIHSLQANALIPNYFDTSTINIITSYRLSSLHCTNVIGVREQHNASFLYFKTSTKKY